MATDAICALLTAVNVHMTAFAILWGTTVLIIDMTLAAFRIRMLTLKHEICLLRMIEVLNWCPMVRCMAGFTCSLKLPFVKIIMTI